MIYHQNSDHLAPKVALMTVCVNWWQGGIRDIVSGCSGSMDLNFSISLMSWERLCGWQESRTKIRAEITHRVIVQHELYRTQLYKFSHTTVCEDRGGRSRKAWHKVRIFTAEWNFQGNTVPFCTMSFISVIFLNYLMIAKWEKTVLSSKQYLSINERLPLPNTHL